MAPVSSFSGFPFFSPGPVGPPTLVPAGFFDRDGQQVALDLLGKVLAHRVKGLWLAARIIETEAYYLEDKASHASLGRTPKRRAMFMPPGTIYMYFSRGGDSFNLSVAGEGNAVLVKSGVPWLGSLEDGLPLADGPAQARLALMSRLNPPGRRHPARHTLFPEPASPSPRRPEARPPQKLCSGQTLLCRALGLQVARWDGNHLPQPDLGLWDTGSRPSQVVRTPRLGISPRRDPHLPYRFVDGDYAPFCTRNPFRGLPFGQEPILISPRADGGWDLP